MQANQIAEDRRNEEKFSFKPKINKSSRTAMDHLNFDERLRYFQEKKQKNFKKIKEKELSRNSYQPKLNPKSLYMGAKLA